jgi:hypothetical protein
MLRKGSSAESSEEPLAQGGGRSSKASSRPHVKRGGGRVERRERHDHNTHSYVHFTSLLYIPRTLHLTCEAATTACSVQVRSWPSLPIFVWWFLQATDRWRHMVSKLHGASMPHRCFCSFPSSYCIFLSGSTWFISPPMRSSKFVTSRLYAIYIAADEIFKIRDISALRDLSRRRWDLQNAWHLGSTRFISPPMRSSKFVASRLYAIYIAAGEIFTTHNISALRDLYHRR